MSKLVADQADGLRRLLARTPTRVIAIAGMRRGMGATSAAMNLAAALVQQGKEVLVLDEHCPSPDSVSGVWAVDPLGTLADVAGQRLTWQGAAATAECGVSVLPALPGQSGQPGADGLVADPRDLWRGNVILIDAAFDSEGRLSPLARMADELVLVFQPQPAAITAVYSGIKRLHYAHALKQVRLLASGVGEVEEAQQVMSNLVTTGSRFLAVSLQSAGWVRNDPHHADARALQQTVVEAYPGGACAADYRRIAADMLQWPWRPLRRRIHSAPCPVPGVDQGFIPACDPSAPNPVAV